MGYWVLFLLMTCEATEGGFVKNWQGFSCLYLTTKCQECMSCLCKLWISRPSKRLEGQTSKRLWGSWGLRESFYLHLYNSLSSPHSIELVIWEFVLKLTSEGGGPSRVMVTIVSPRKSTKPIVLFSCFSSLFFFPRTQRNSSQSARITFMCLSKAAREWIFSQDKLGRRERNKTG